MVPCWSTASFLSAKSSHSVFVPRIWNITNVLILNVLDCAIGGAVFWAFGYAIVRGDHHFSTPFYGVGKYFFNPDVYSLGSGEEMMRFSITCAYVSAATTIPSGAMAER